MLSARRRSAAKTALSWLAATSAALGVVRGAARKASADACMCCGSGSDRLRAPHSSLLPGGGGGANAAEASAASYSSVMASPHLARWSIHASCGSGLSFASHSSYVEPCSGKRLGSRISYDGMPWTM